MMNRKDKDRYGLLRKLAKGGALPLVDSEDFYSEVDRLLKRAFKGSIRSRFRWLDDATLDAFFSEALLAICEVQRVKGVPHLDSHPSTFMRRIRYTLACKEAKRAARFHDLDEVVIERFGQMDHDPMVRERDHILRMDVVKGLVGELPQKQRQLFIGYYFQRKRLKDLAVEVGYTTNGSAKSAKSKGQRWLKKAIREHYPELLADWRSAA
ncbi:MAG: sigma-70 family RNA polymerase sigma factor [Flavobacteriales bacterium]|nr:sigma-70 family RNA polymerase sigma factor [Flavobacteriales bacterium]